MARREYPRGRCCSAEGFTRSTAGAGAGNLDGNSRQNCRPASVKERTRFLLYWLLYQKLFPYFSPFRIFRFLTFRTAFASLTALFMGLIIGPAVIRQLREFQIGQYIREEGPQAHQKKAGTPTMGGVLIVIAIVIPTILWADLSNRFVWLALFGTIAFGGVGFADDYLKVIHQRNLGLTGRGKLILQVLIAAVIGVLLVVMQGKGDYSTQLMEPVFKNLRPDLVVNALHGQTRLCPLGFLPIV